MTTHPDRQSLIDTLRRVARFYAESPNMGENIVNIGTLDGDYHLSTHDFLNIADILETE